MNLSQYLDEFGRGGLDGLAVAVGVSPGYLYLCATGHKRPSTKLAEKLVDGDPHQKLGFDAVARFQRAKPIRKYSRHPAGGSAQ